MRKSLHVKTTLTLLVGMALGAVAPAVANGRWQVLPSAEWLPQTGTPGAFIRALKGRDQMRTTVEGGNASYSIKMDGGAACTVKAMKNTRMTVMLIAPNGESYAADIGPEIKIGYAPPDVPAVGVPH